MAVLISLAWGAAAIQLGPRWGFVDLPDGDLKTHQVPAVPLGGVGIFLGLHLGLGVIGRFSPVLVAGTLILVVLGLVDDRRGLDPVPRLLVTAAAGAVLALGESNLIWGLALVAVVIVLVNAVNLFDGLDALAGSSTAVSLLGLAWLGANRGTAHALTALVAALAVIGFLYWNRPQARVFLGDNGAYLIGGVLAYMCWRVSTNWLEALVAVALVGAPLFDLAVTVLRRYRTGVALFAGDRDHTYDRLHRSWSVSKVISTYVLAQAAWVGLVVGLESIWGSLPAAVVAAGIGLVTALVLSRR